MLVSVPGGGVAGWVRGAARFMAHGAAEMLWPTRCVGCEAPGTLLCPDCAAALPAIEQKHACPRCGAPFGSLVCTECTDCCRHGDDAEPAPHPLDALDGVRCFGVHDWPLDRLVRAYKDGGERRVSSLLAGLLARVAGDVCAGAENPRASFDAVTFVPCTPQAFARRGFDHMELVARELAGRLGLPLRDVLARHAPRDQRGLTRADRAANAQASLVAVEPVDDARLLLVDDVLTTGATLGASACALKRAGAAHVGGATVARAW